MFEIFIILLLTATGLFWANSMRVRERAVAYTRNYCSKQGLQLLDQSVELRRTRFRRTTAGHYSIFREYHFDFTVTGEERYHGNVKMIGNIPSSFELQPHRLPDNFLD